MIADRFTVQGSLRPAAWLALSVWSAASLAAQEVPVTRQAPVREVLHGVELIDPYRWLEDQWSPETRAWIDEQNAYTASLIGELPGREMLAARIATLLKVDVVGMPVVRGDRYFFSKRAADQDLSVIYVREGVGGEDQPLVDPHVMQLEEATSVSLRDVSRDGTLLAYAIRKGGQDEVTVRFLDVDRRRVLRDMLPRARYFGISITPDNAGFYYTHYDEHGPRVRYHAFGTALADDRELFGEGLDQGTLASAQLSHDGSKLLISVYHGSAGPNDLFLMDLASGGPAQALAEGIDANFFGAFAGSDRLVVRTNHQAPNWRLMVVDVARPAMADWREIVSEGQHVMRGFTLAGGSVLVAHLENVVGRLTLYSVDGRRVRDVDVPGIGSIGGVSGEWDRDEVFFSYSSYNTPSTVYRYSVSADTRSVWTHRTVPFDGAAYEVKQVWYRSKDGTRIPMFLMHRRGLVLDGNNPTYLTGYGGFNVSRTPGFSPSAAVWVEFGGVYAVPNLRGGGEFGEEWHRAGMLKKKQNVFDDFLAAAQWLIDEGYTSPGKLAIAGGSNGGLLVGAALTQRPELFRAVLCRVPLLDMIRYQNFLVARFWVPEYGSAENAEQFPYLLEYSPYHNVEHGALYPAVLFDTGDGDTRVDPLHARKMTALLQAATGADRPVLLRYDTEAGHSGGLRIDKSVENLTAQLSFLLWQLDVPLAPHTP